MDAVDVLMEARAYIEKGWCQQRAAKDEHGRAVPVSSPLAWGWCAVGALMAAAMQEADWATGLSEAEDLVAQATGCVTIPNWNDRPGRTQAEVLEAFDRAIGLGLERAGER